MLGVVGLTSLSLATERTPESALHFARQLEQAFVQVAEQVSPSVVVITAIQKTSDHAQREEETEPDMDEESPFRFFFRHHGFLFPPPRELDSQGSGVIVRRDGYILTNHHVVDGASEIKVRLRDGREFAGRLIGFDQRTDLAVLKIEAENLPVAEFGDSDAVKVGQWAIAIGAPFQLDYSFTVGFVSATGRSGVWGRGSNAFEDYIQTDASINPGNSGGPLCNIEGRVIGINTLIRGLNRGIGFAIPANMARSIATQLIEKGRIVRPWLGIQIEELASNPELQQTLPPGTEGVVIRAIYPDTPAAQSDLKPADVVVAVDDTPVRNPRDLQLQILRRAVGDRVNLRVLRDGQPLTITLQTGELPDRPQLASQRAPREPATQTTWGIEVQSITRELAERLQLPIGSGVYVSAVTPGSPAAEQGLQQGDVITEVNRRPVRTAAEFHAALAGADPQKGALLYVQRGGASTFLVLKPRP
ncbi:MAG: Do family serine endopeptidase [Verrucomicrobiae bacterium]|nr:Do family serine endopeptidase [Verrucomicrobiae bacterium]